MDTSSPKYLFASIDVETTGLEAYHCQTIELGIVLEDGKSPIKQLPSLRLYILHGEYRGEAAALVMNQSILGKLAELEAKYPLKRLNPFDTIVDVDTSVDKHGILDQVGPHVTGWARLPLVSQYVRNWLEQYWDFEKSSLCAVGKNYSGFDHQFLENIPYWQDKIPIKHRSVDPVSLFYHPLEDGCNPPSTKLCCERAGIEYDTGHRSVEDAQQVIRLLRKGYGYPE